MAEGGGGNIDPEIRNKSIKTEIYVIMWSNEGNIPYKNMII